MNEKDQKYRAIALFSLGAFILGGLRGLRLLLFLDVRIVGLLLDLFVRIGKAICDTRSMGITLDAGVDGISKKVRSTGVGVRTAIIGSLDVDSARTERGIRITLGVSTDRRTGGDNR